MPLIANGLLQYDYDTCKYVGFHGRVAIKLLHLCWPLSGVKG